MTRSVTSHLSLTAEFGWHVTREVGASLLTCELYPIGFLGNSTPRLPRPRKTPYQKHPPILFIHGIFHNRATFTYLIQRLAWAGWRSFKEENFWTGFHSIPKMAEQTALHVHQLIKTHGVPQVDIVAHSMGGIVARHFIQKLGGDGLVRHLVTLGTPHQGTNLSRYFLLPKIKELMPTSRIIRDLNDLGIPQKTQAMSISGNLDVMIHPRRHAWWDGVRNIRLRGLGHAGLLYSRRVFQLIRARLEPVEDPAQPWTPTERQCMMR